jgi:formiminotetrahydrofolate cyclodeaminase
METSMKNLALLIAITFTALFTTTSEVQAVPAFAKAFKARVTDKSKNADFVAAVTAAKCNLCHFATPESKSKKQKNDYGKELAKHLSKKNYTSTRIKEEAAAVNKEFDAAFAKVMAAKNPSGETYQSRVDAGKLPGSVNEK